MFSNQLSPHRAQNNFLKSKEASEEGGKGHHPRCTPCAPPSPGSLPLSQRLQTLARRAGRPRNHCARALPQRSRCHPHCSPFSPTAELCFLREEKVGREDGQGERFRGLPLPWREQVAPDMVRRQLGKGFFFFFLAAPHGMREGILLSSPTRD